ncbi:UPF0729 protein C18orf32 homolog [Tachypleus tridentatus]|uniref:UPF0729 protein C18orf32 homolog n=1 Tax=Tachypleus tridentatus TaxID=6853 RepID=UPI003FD4B996
MVCVPCILAPILLWVWYRFIQPIIAKYWNPKVADATIECTPEGCKLVRKPKAELQCPVATEKKEEVKENGLLSNGEVTAQEKKDL